MSQLGPPEWPSPYLPRESEPSSEDSLCPPCLKVIKGLDSRIIETRFDCLIRIISQHSCPLCKLVATCIGEVGPCSCHTSQSLCVKLLQEARPGYEALYEPSIWGIHCQNIWKGQIVCRNEEGFIRTDIVERSGIAPLINIWLEKCTSDHHDCALSPYTDVDGQPSRGQHDTSHVVDLLFIDTIHNCIVDGLDVQHELQDQQSHPSYAALSYVWGSATQVVALQANIHQLRQKGSLVTSQFAIPNLIKDAMSLVQSLGIQYLWVDALCILQDAESKHDVLSQMDTIYSRAYLTIIASDCDSAADSLPGIQPVSQTPLSPHVQIGKHYLRSERRGHLPSHLFHTKYNTRGWTLQEALLSKRCVYFTNEQAIFRCRKSVWAEHAPYRDMGTAADLYARLWEGLMSRVGWEKVEPYRRLVSEYSNRQLSFDSDILNAFAGITGLLCRTEAWTFMDGVLMNEVPSEILFFHDTRSARRRNEYGEPWLPSWSWAGWTGKVRYATMWNMNWQITWLSIKQSFRLGASYIKDIVVYPGHDWKSRTFGPGAHSMKMTVGTYTRPGYTIEWGASPFESGHLVSLLQFYARTKPAVHFRIEAWSPPPLGSPSAIHHLYQDDRRVGMLLDVDSVASIPADAEFVQITEFSSLLVTASSCEQGIVERIGVAFFWVAGVLGEGEARKIILG